MNDVPDPSLMMCVGGLPAGFRALVAPAEPIAEHGPTDIFHVHIAYVGIALEDGR